MRKLQQNGAGASGRQSEYQASIKDNGRSGSAKQFQDSHLNSASSSGTSSPSTRSPAKQKQRIAYPERPLRDPEMEVSRPQNAVEPAVHITQDPIAAFPTSGRPVSDTVLKDMLLSLKASLHTDMTAGINHCQREVQALGRRVDHIEQYMSDFTSSFNTMVDAHSNHDEEIAWLKNKVADLEDRSRRNNIKIRGIPETIPVTQLQSYTQVLFSTLLPSLSPQDLIVDRIHCIPKPAFLPENTPRDVLLRVHYYHIKEQILTTSRRTDNRHPQYAKLQLLEGACPDVKQGGRVSAQFHVSSHNLLPSSACFAHVNLRSPSVHPWAPCTTAPGIIAEFSHHRYCRAYNRLCTIKTLRHLEACEAPCILRSRML